MGRLTAEHLEAIVKAWLLSAQWLPLRKHTPCGAQSGRFLSQVQLHSSTAPHLSEGCVATWSAVWQVSLTGAAPQLHSSTLVRGLCCHVERSLAGFSHSSPAPQLHTCNRVVLPCGAQSGRFLSQLHNSTLVTGLCCHVERSLAGFSHSSPAPQLHTCNRVVLPCGAQSGRFLSQLHNSTTPHLSQGCVAMWSSLAGFSHSSTAPHLHTCQWVVLPCGASLAGFSHSSTAPQLSQGCVAMWSQSGRFLSQLHTCHRVVLPCGAQSGRFLSQLHNSTAPQLHSSTLVTGLCLFCYYIE